MAKAFEPVLAGQAVGPHPPTRRGQIVALMNDRGESSAAAATAAVDIRKVKADVDTELFAPTPK